MTRARAFTAIVQLGTMAAVLLYFRHDLWNMARAFLRTLTGDRPLWRTKDIDGRLGWYLVLGTIPIVILGFAFKNVIEDRAAHARADRERDDPVQPRPLRGRHARHAHARGRPS